MRQRLALKVASADNVNSLAFRKELPLFFFLAGITPNLIGEFEHRAAQHGGPSLNYNDIVVTGRRAIAAVGFNHGQNAVVLDDVLVVLQRAEMTSRMAERIKRDCVELGSEGRLIRLQLEELVGDVPAERDAIVRDYAAASDGPEIELSL